MKRLLLIIACLLCFSHSAFADTFGNSAGNDDNQISAVNAANCSKFTPSSSGTITKITSHWIHFGIDNNIRAAIYSDLLGVPNALIAQSSSNVLVTATGDYDSTVSASITSGTPYWLCGMSSANDIAFASTNGSSNDGHRNYTAVTFPTFPSPYVIDDSQSSVYRIWATFTPSGGGATCNGGLMLMGAGGC